MSLSFPSAAALAAARQRHQGALAAVYGGTVVIGGTSYAAAVDCGPVEWIETPGGSRRGQRAVCRIAKSDLATAPAKDASLTTSGVVYQVQSIGGRNARDVAWVVHCVRWEGDA